MYVKYIKYIILGFIDWLLLGVEEHRTRHQNGMIH